MGDTRRAERFLEQIAFCDLCDLTGTTSEGLHMANMGGIWLAFAYGFAGLRVNGSGLCLSPVCPSVCSGFSFCLNYLGRKLKVQVGRGHSSVSLLAGEPLVISVDGEPVALSAP